MFLPPTIGIEQLPGYIQEPNGIPDGHMLVMIRVKWIWGGGATEIRYGTDTPDKVASHIWCTVPLLYVFESTRPIRQIGDRWFVRQTSKEFLRAVKAVMYPEL